MESSPQHSHEPLRHHSSKPSLHAHFPQLTSLPLRTNTNTPMSSPGLFNPSPSRIHLHGAHHSLSESNTPAPQLDSPYLHPLQNYQVRETHKALVESDLITGRKSINQYEVIEEIGRGMHGKVKLARNTKSGENVAIKIIPRFSKKRRFGKLTALSPQDKTKKEIAILKKIRHPNVVALLEVIDDPELKKIYMVLEHVELGEIVWRKKGLPHICNFERKRIEREMRGDPPSVEEERYDRLLEERQAVREMKRAKLAQTYKGQPEYWSVEHGAADDGGSIDRWSRISSRENFATADGVTSQPISRCASTAPSRSDSLSTSPSGVFHDNGSWNEDMTTPGPSSTVAHEGSMFGGPFSEEIFSFRERSPSMADSIISHMSSIDYNPRSYDVFADDYSYVPCFTFDQARSAFRDTVLGLEYLHYQGVVHRDIKPANLLWSKDHRVKISDFGVSYFGRPIRDGEPDELVSESEAKDFDDDLELSKTVGTPAFFAPELCYTDPDKKQPKISEQIDVWSLGVTLYCLIFARIPFLAEDEFQMFKKIATEDIYIPHRRLKPVDPSTSPVATSLYKRQNIYPCRDDANLDYEDVDDSLYDLLKKMLVKNPEKRIRLRDIKRHPWVLEGLHNPVAWLDETDPARPSSGTKIQVNEREMSSAVVPLTFLERARSVMKKAVGKVMHHPFVERSDSRSRRRATSSAASSAGDSMFKTNPSTTQVHNDRPISLHPDPFVHRAEDNSSTEDQPVTASIAPKVRDATVYDPMATVLPPVRTPVIARGRSHSELNDVKGQTTKFSRQGTLRRKRSQHFLHLTPHITGPHTTPASPSYDGHRDPTWDGAMGMSLIGRLQEFTTGEASQSFSTDRNLFTASDKRASPHVSLNTMVAPGNIQTQRTTRAMRSVDLGKHRHSYGVSSSPLSSSPQSLPPNNTYQHNQPKSDPNFYSRQREERPLTAHRVDSADVSSPLTRGSMTASPESRIEACSTRFLAARASPAAVRTEWPDQTEAPSRGDTMNSIKTTSSESIDRLGTPLTSPSDSDSPIIPFSSKTASERMLAFQSDPSLPALLSGASSVSADLEGELLGQPGVVNSLHPGFLGTEDSLTPPALCKEPTAGFPLDQAFDNSMPLTSGTLAMLSSSRPSSSHSVQPDYQADYDDDDDDDDGSDDGGLEMRSSKKTQPVIKKGPPFEVRRRDTNFSAASDETAKRVGYNYE